MPGAARARQADDVRGADVSRAGECRAGGERGEVTPPLPLIPPSSWRKPGPITTGLGFDEGQGSSATQQQTPVVMGPGFRQDDSEQNPACYRFLFTGFRF